MTAPEDRNGPREALARAVEAGFDSGIRHCGDGNISVDAQYDAALADAVEEAVADALIAGPLASLIAERDAAVAGLAQATANIEKLSAAIHDAASVLEARALAAEAEITRLKEGMEGRERALGLALRFVDRAAGEGLSFDADGEWPAMDAADVCFAVAEALGIEDLDSDAYRALVACPDLATLSPKEHPMAETPSAPSLRDVIAALDAAEIQECHVNGDKADVISAPPGSTFINEYRTIARCSTGPLWIKQAVAIATALNFVRSLDNAPSTTLTEAVAAARAEGVREGLERAAEALRAIQVRDRFGAIQGQLRAQMSTEWLDGYDAAAGSRAGRASDALAALKLDGSLKVGSTLAGGRS